MTERTLAIVVVVLIAVCALIGAIVRLCAWSNKE
jgi:hypothetical protein